MFKKWTACVLTVVLLLTTGLTSLTVQGKTIAYGDVNSDGDVNMKDILLLRRYIAGLGSSIDLVAADYNRDQSVDMKDVLVIRKWIAGVLDYTDFEPRKLTPFTDSQIAALQQHYVAGDCHEDNGPCYYLIINSISKSSAQIDIGYVGYNLSPVYESYGIIVPLEWENAEKTVLVGSFNWTDSWGNSGTGVLRIEKMLFVEPYVTLNMQVTHEAEWGNRATLATNGDKHFILDLHYL